MYRPSLEEVENLKGKFRRVPVSFEMMADMETPIRLLKKVEKISSHHFLLESVEGGENWGRYSFIGYDPALTVTVLNGKTTVESKDGSKKIWSCNPVQTIRDILNDCKAPHFDYLPRFAGGAVGFFGYDMVRYCENLPDHTENKEDYPDCSLMIADKIISYDNVRQKIVIIVNMEMDGDIRGNYKSALSQIGEIYKMIRSAADEGPEQPEHFSKPEWNSNLTKEEFENCVRSAKEYIRNGDIFQVVLSQRFSARMDHNLQNIYRVLRVTNPSPYMYYLKLGNIEIAGASPETLLRLDCGTLETCPIAGSRPRGRNALEDQKLTEELLRDEKELAEHNMLVDLGRNDLGRVSKFGSVKVAEYCKVVYYSQIMHLTSLVTSQLSENCDAFDALSSILPAGTLSGAPKVRAMEIIDEFERLHRGPYGGAVGYIGFDGNMDVCITIRTIVKKDNMAFVQAGAGIVADSVPENEYYESVNKAKAVLLAAEKAVEIV